LYKFLYKITLIIILFVLSFSCSNTKYLEKNESLFKDNKLKISKTKDVQLSRDLRNELNDVLYPEANNKFLGLNLSLWIYNHTKEPKEKNKGLRNFFKYKLGEKPVIYNEKTPSKVVLLLENRLQNNGFYQSEINQHTIINKQRSITYYNVLLHKPFVIDTVIFQIKDSVLTQIIKNNICATLIKKDDIYSLQTVKNERQRIVKDFRNEGYYFFRNDFLVYNADTNNLGNRIKFYVRYKSNLKTYQIKKYNVGDISLSVNKNINDKSFNNSEAIVVDSINYKDYYKIFKAHKMTQNIFFKPNHTYSDSLYRKTLSYFYGYDILNSLNINFKLKDTLSRKVDADILFTQSKKMSIVTKLIGATKTNGFSGPSMEITFANRNIFRGGEKISFTFEGGIEKQIGEETSLDYIFRTSLKGELQLPNFTPGFKNISKHSIRLPYSLLDAKVTYLKYHPTMEIWETSASYAYKWFPNKNNSWDVRPVTFVYQKIFENEVLNVDDVIDLPYVPFGLENQFSLGLMATYTVTNKNTSKTRNAFFFKTTVETAGNVIYAIYNNFSDKQEQPYTVFNQPFSQFGRIDIDFRYYRKLKKSNSLATRFLSYFAIPYGNSIDLPFFRKYFAGGPNSLRGFQTGGVGPGVFYNKDVKPDIRINNGDIRLEANIEYRFKIAGNFFSVLFIDAGNVWLVREDTLRPGGKIEFDKILQTSSVSIGTGLRYDFSVIAIRLDLGIPIKYPYKEKRGDVYGDTDLIDWKRFSQTMILHFAIDYPF